MADPTVLQERFTRAMRRDIPRHQLPANVAWNLVDWIPDSSGSPLRERGGWGYQSNDISAVKATAAYVIGGLYAPFVAAAKNLAVDEDGELYSVAANGTVTDIGAAVTVSQNPVFHRDKAIIPAAGGATAPKYYDGTTLGNLAGSPPTAVYACVHKDRTVLARTTANPTALYFSDAGDPALWDVTNVFVETSFPITGIVSLKNAILVWSDGAVERLIGSTPPPNSDFVFGKAFDEGTPDARSIAFWGDNIVFANPSGIFVTDGSRLDDLTKAAGMLAYWQELLASYSSTWTLGAGVNQSYYVISVMDGSTFKDAAMIDLERRTWIRLSNLKAVSFWSSSAPDEMYFGLRSAPRVGKFSSVYLKSSTVKNDGDGTAVTAVYESPFFVSKGKALRWKHVILDGDVRDAASDNPTFGVSYIESPEATSYTSITGSFAETTAQGRKRLPVGRKNRGMAFKITRTNAAADARLVRLSAEVHELEKSVG